MAFKI